MRLDRFNPFAAPQADEPARALMIDGEAVPVTLRENALARRFILRIDKTGRGVTVTMPRAASAREALAFARAQEGWVRARLGRTPDHVAFEDGARVPFRGRMHLIAHAGAGRGTVWREDGAEPVLHVAGAPAHLPRRLRDWLKAEARKAIAARVHVHAGRLALTPGRISIRDQTSRWGSCAANGALAFSWRLILAPDEVLDYVAAHEVAHLREMNHGPRFWALVEQTMPDMKAHRRWLKRHGGDLHRYGRD